MTGDRSKPESSSMRWVDFFGDGKFKKTKKGKIRVPNISSEGKRYNRRWRRRQEKTI